MDPSRAYSGVLLKKLFNVKLQKIGDILSDLVNYILLH